MGKEEENNDKYKGMMISTIEGESALAFEEDLARRKEKKFDILGSLPSLASTIEEEAVVERRPKTKLLRKLREFSLETTGHGLPRIIEAEQYYMKFIWLACYLVAIALCVFMVVRNIQQYLGWGVSSQILVVSMPTITFPVLSLCNVNPLITPAGNNYLRNYYNSRYNLNLTSYSDYYEAVKKGTIPEENDWILYQTYAANFSRDIKKSFGFDAPTMFSNCQFNGLDCDVNEFEWFYHPKYGNCYRFNSIQDPNNNDPNTYLTGLFNVTVQGTGFYIEVFAGFPDSYYNYFYEMPNRGLVLLIENQQNYPLLGKNGVSVNLASYTKMVITHSSYQKSPAPYSDCPDINNINTELAKELTNLNVEGTNRTYIYSRTNCMILCEQKQKIVQLGCYDMRYPAILGAPPCSTKTQFEQLSQLKLNLSECASQCPYECNTEDFSLSISYTDFPSWDFYYQKLHSNADFYEKLFNLSVDDITYEMFTASVASVFLYYDDLVDTQITESPSLTLVTLISNIGGIMGLFIGVSILSFVEFIELAVTFVIIVCQEYRNRKKEEKEMAKREVQDQQANDKKDQFFI